VKTGKKYLRVVQNRFPVAKDKPLFYTKLLIDQTTGDVYRCNGALSGTRGRRIGSLCYWKLLLKKSTLKDIDPFLF
jgi:hypothetical protein